MDAKKFSFLTRGGAIRALKVTSYILLGMGIDGCANSFQSGPSNVPAAGTLSIGDTAALLVSGVGTQLPFLTAPQSLEAGTCSSVATLALLNGKGQPITFQGSIGIPVMGSEAMSFFTDSGCRNSASEVRLKGSTATAQFYFIGTQSGLNTISLNLLDLISASQTETINGASSTPTPGPTATPVATPKPTATPVATPAPTPVSGSWWKPSAAGEWQWEIDHPLSLASSADMGIGMTAYNGVVAPSLRTIG